MSTQCLSVIRNLGAYLDDELPGADRLAVEDHLAVCPSCAGEESAVRGLGDSLRLIGAGASTPPDQLAGLAGGVTSRIFAEEQQSWGATRRRAFENWHWLAVGVGSVTAALISFTLASLMLYSSVAQLTQMNARAGTLYVMALPQTGGGEPILMQFEETLNASQDSASRPDVRHAMPASFGWQAERALVAALDATLMRNGQSGDLRDMPSADREEVLALMKDISRIRYQEPVRRPGGLTNVVGMYFTTTTSVVANGI
jgi:hypothetical protein